MGKFYGKIGYAKQVETDPGVWENTIVERFYYGDVTRSVMHNNPSEYINDKLKVNNEISVIADAFAYDNFQDIVYVELFNSKWKVSSVEMRRPRLILNVGGIYNEETYT